MIGFKSVLFQSFLILSTAFAEDSEAEIQGCVDPLAAIMTTLNCVAIEDVACASAGYNDSFIKLHNSVDTNTVIDSGGSFWSNAFLQLNFAFSYHYTANIGPNRASVRYVEDVTFTDGSDFGLPASTEYPFGLNVLQYEHALVTVDDDCKIILWDQYGDNAEQDAVDDASFAMIEVLCTVGIFPAPVCTDTFGIIVTVPTPEDPKCPKAPKSTKGRFRH